MARILARPNAPKGFDIGLGSGFPVENSVGKPSLLFAGVEWPHRDLILGPSLKGMDMHYIVTSDESLTKAMDRFKKWLDGEMKLQNVDQSLSKNQKKLINAYEYMSIRNF